MSAQAGRHERCRAVEEKAAMAEWNDWQQDGGEFPAEQYREAVSHLHAQEALLRRTKEAAAAEERRIRRIRQRRIVSIAAAAAAVILLAVGAVSMQALRTRQDSGAQTDRTETAAVFRYLGKAQSAEDGPQPVGRGGADEAAGGGTSIRLTADTEAPSYADWIEAEEITVQDMTLWVGRSDTDGTWRAWAPSDDGGTAGYTAVSDLTEEDLTKEAFAQEVYALVRETAAEGE